MRSAAISLLVAVGVPGCNAIFGLDQTTPLDASVDAPVVHPMTFTLRVATSDVNGYPVEPSDAPIPDLMSIEATSLDGTQSQPITLGADGTFDVSDEVFSAGRWRLIYQRTGDVPHEIQQLPDGAHFVEPMFGRVARTAVPAGAGFVIIPSGGPASHPEHRVFTTGLWTDGRQTPAPTTGTLNYTFTDAASLDGPLGAPEAAHGDRALLVDYATDGASACHYAIGSVDFPPDVAVPKSTPSGVWKSDLSLLPTVSTDYVGPTGLANRLSAIKPADANVGPARIEFGYAPSSVMPAFTRRPIAGASLLANPVMLPLRTCPYVGLGAPAQPTFHNPFYLGGTSGHYPPVVHLELTTTRQVSAGLSLISGLIVATPNAGANTYAVEHTAAIPDGITLKLGSGAVVDLLAAPDHGVVEAPTGSLELAWTVSTDAATVGTADYWEVVLLEVLEFGTTRRRVFITTTHAVTIDAGLLAANTEYAFELTAYTGRPQASAGDFTDATLPQSATVVTSRTFKTP